MPSVASLLPEPANTSPPALCRPRLSPSSASRLRARLEAVALRNGSTASSRPCPTGIPELDRALGGGIPRGRITEISGPLAAGKTTLMHGVISHMLATGAWVAWIDASRTLAPAPWAELGCRFVVIRPRSPHKIARAADLLLRSAVFNMVVIDGAPPLSRIQGIRLSQLAREHDAACVVLTHTLANSPMHAHVRTNTHTDAQQNNSRLTGTLRLHVSPVPALQKAPQQVLQKVLQPTAQPTAQPTLQSTSQSTASETLPSRTRVTVLRGAALSSRQPVTEIDRVIHMAHRLCAHPEIPDRRGVARGPRRPWDYPDSSERDSRPDNRSSTLTPITIAAPTAPVSGGGIGVITHDLYGIGVSEPIHFAAAQRHRELQHAATHTQHNKRTDAQPGTQPGVQINTQPNKKNLAQVGA